MMAWLREGKVSADDERINLATRLKQARDYLGLSQDEVAQRAGLKRAAISLIESGQRRVEALELKKLAKIYGRTLNELTGEEGNDPTQSELVDHLARKAEKLSEKSQEELLNFAKYLESRAKQGDED
jgi:transcriptional regulator with XRE-family HTH domain